MNVFFLSRNVQQCAVWHNDPHVRQMMREYPHLLSITHRMVSGSPRVDGRYTIWDHPNAEMDEHLYHVGRLADNVCSVWTRHSVQNYRWLYGLYEALAAEYRYRFHADHDSWTRLGEMLREPPPGLPDSAWTPPYTAMHERFVIEGDALHSYRDCYRWGKHPLAVWTGREPPEWYMVEGMQRRIEPPGKTGQLRVRALHPGVRVEITPRGKRRGFRPERLAA